MLSTTAKRAEIQEHISEYLDMVAKGEEIIVLEDEGGQELGRFLPRCKTAKLVAERVAAIMRGDIDINQIKEEALRRRHALESS